MKKNGINTKKKIVFIITSVIGIIAFLELCGSLFYYLGFNKTKRELLEISIGAINVNRNIVVKFKSHPYFNYICNPEYQLEDGNYPHNSRGFRKPEWSIKSKDVIRIITLGGSTTYGINSTDGKDVWPALLQLNLKQMYDEKIEVINMGINNYTAFEILGVTGMILPFLKPDIVIFHLGANDAFTACYPDEGGSDNSTFRFSWAHKPLPDLIKFLMRKSRLLRIISYGYISSKGYLPGDMTQAMQYRFPPVAEAKKNGDKSNGKYFKNNLSQIIAMVKNMGSIPVLLTHPLNPKWDYTKNELYKIIINAHNRNNDIIKIVADREKSLIIPLYIKMRDSSSFVDAVHNNIKGMREKASIIAEDLIPLIEKIKSL